VKPDISRRDIATFFIGLFALTLLILSIFIVIYDAQKTMDGLKRSRQTLDWLSRQYQYVRDQNERLIAENEVMTFYTNATRAMRSDWLDMLTAVWISSKKYDIPAELVLAVIHRESNFDKLAQSYFSYSEQPIAVGLMQVNYQVWKDELQLDFDKLFQVKYNIDVGCQILKRYYDESGNWHRALLLYNNGYRITNLGYGLRVMDSKFYRGMK
jgi:soluble lytic murein transglycosylase-like protein